ncbi:piwi-like protein Ago3 [Folsomia candida]|uniref:piwi-like protein Ago3 n=1 Tax=Folsomia candida TaxID=158441 RepID=UPI001604A598|nr:piwi-like protein Ago3 [Folsomia candida]
MSGRGIGRGRGSLLPPNGAGSGSLGGGRGRGGGRGVLFSSDHFVLEDDDEAEQETAVTGFQREREDATPSQSDSDEDDFISQFRKLHAPRTTVSEASRSTTSTGTVRWSGRGRKPAGAAGGGVLDLVDNCYPVIAETPSPTKVYSSVSSSSGEELSGASSGGNAVIVKSGELGKNVSMCVNYIRLEHLEKDRGGVWEYHVDFDPPLGSKKLRWSVLHSLVDIMGPTLNFDGGSKLFLPFELRDGVTNLSTPHPADHDDTVDVVIKHIKKQELEESVHFYNILLRQVFRELGLIEMQRNFYDYKNIFQVPEHKLEIWPGFVTAVEVYQDGLMLNCDSSFRVLRTDTMLNALDQMMYTEQNEGVHRYNARERFKEYALGKVVLTKYNNKHYRVDDVDWESTPESTFTQMRNGNPVQVSFIEYYRTNYNVIIRDSDQPMLVTRGKIKRQQHASNWSPPENILLVPELCFVTGMTEEITSDFRIMKVVADKTRIPPLQRYHALQAFIESVNTQPKVRSIFEKWGLRLADGIVNLNGRVIGPPKMILGGNAVVLPQGGEFNRDLLRSQVLEPVPIQDWLVVCSSMDEPRAIRAIQNYGQVARPLGIPYKGDPRIIRVQKNRPSDFREALVNNIVEGVTQFVMVILPSNRDDLYRVVKTVCNHELAVASQVIRGQTLNDERKVRSVMQKVALQINCKLGGALWTIRIPMIEKIMFLGMDVYHDPKRHNRSVTAVVASINVTYTKYYSRCIFQQQQQESISSLRPVFLDALLTFQEHDGNGAFPDRVIMFRDGVGDGQLELTRQYEVAQMLSCFQELGIDPKFTFTVVQKRINARMFLDTGSHIENVEPGTVLDHTVTRRNYFDFFLVSQLIREGTVNPTHYIVLHDNSDIKPDVIQKFAYATSFMYYNWAGSIRVPAMCQYAHKAAGLVGQHIGREPSAKMNDKLYYL